MKKQLLLAVAVLALAACGKTTSSNANTVNENTSSDVSSVESSLTSEQSSESSNASSSEAISSSSQVVVGEKGTLTNPYTIAEAIAIIGKTTTYSSKQIYIKGIVREKPYYNEKYQSYSAYLVDQGGTASVQVYSGTIDANAGQKDIKEGDTVIAGGYYCYYEKNSQPELAGDTKSNVAYPIYYSIVRSGVVIEDTFETLEDDGRETVTTTLEFTAANAETMAGTSETNPKNIAWKCGIVTMEYDPGSQYSFELHTDPFRFYVGTYLHIRVSTGKIKYLQFDTNSNYPFTGDEPVTYGKTDVQSTTKTYIFAKTDTNYIKIHNSNKGQVKDVPIKQKRFQKLTVVSYK